MKKPSLYEAKFHRKPVTHSLPAAASPTAQDKDAKSSNGPLEEADLIRCAQGGDNEAFDALVALHQNKVFNLCRWNLGNDEDAADAAQDVFVRAWKALPHFRGDCALSTWLHRIAVNVISDTASRRQRAPLPVSNLENADGETAELEVEDFAGDANPSEVALSHARRRAVQNALADLPEPQRAVLVLFDVQGHSYEDLATILELPLGTVKSRLSRARLALRERLEAHRELWDG
jgi:RNA polymerase sigma-70 factor (ECF subfamily)